MGLLLLLTHLPLLILFVILANVEVNWEGWVVSTVMDYSLQEHIVQDFPILPPLPPGQTKATFLPPSLAADDCWYVTHDSIGFFIAMNHANSSNAFRFGVSSTLLAPTTFMTSVLYRNFTFYLYLVVNNHVMKYYARFHDPTHLPKAMPAAIVLYDMPPRLNNKGSLNILVRNLLTLGEQLLCQSHLLFVNCLHRSTTPQINSIT